MFEASFEMAQTRAWIDLAHEVTASPFALPGVVAAAHRMDGLGRLRTYEHREGDDLAGHFTLRRRRSLRASGFQMLLSSQAGPIARTHEAAVAVLLEAAHDTGRLFEIRTLNGSLFDVPRLASDLTDNGCTVEATELYTSPSIALAADGEQQRALLSRKRRQELERSRRRLDELGGAKFDMIDTAERPIDPVAVEDILRLEAASWKGREGSAMTSNQRSEEYFRSVLGWAAEEKILHLNRLLVGDQLAAASFALRVGSTLYGMKTAYDERFRKHGPGLLLLQEEVLCAIDRGLERLELLGAGANHKNDFANSERRIWRLRVGLRRPVPIAQLKVGRPVDLAAQLLWYRTMDGLKKVRR